MSRYKTYHVKSTAHSFEECVEKVRELAGRHNQPQHKGPIERKKRELLPCEKLGWSANPYVQWLLAGKPVNDTRFLQVGQEGYYFFRRKIAGEIHRRALHTTNYLEAIERRNVLLRDMATVGGEEE
jgi:hypothetical protein